MRIGCQNDMAMESVESFKLEMEKLGRELCCLG